MITAYKILAVIVALLATAVGLHTALVIAVIVMGAGVAAGCCALDWHALGTGWHVTYWKTT